MSLKTFLITSAMAMLPAVLGSSIPKNTELLETRQSCAYSGTYEDFPPQSSWLSFSDIFNAYEQYMVDAGSTWDDVGRIAVAVEQAAANIGVDEAVIFAIIIQESSGYVGVNCSADNTDCGLMQCLGCPSFEGQNDLPQADTSAMVNGGTEHFKSNLEDFGDLDAPSSIYPALREYNSGCVNPDGDLSEECDNYGVPCYVSEVAQRLMGEVF